MALPPVGSTAPDFTLPSTSGKDVTLSSFRGSKNVLIAFFPLAFTGTCTKEMSAFSQDLLRFEGQETLVLPISVDSTATLKEYQAKEKLPFDLLSDFKRTVSRLYGVLHEEKFHSKRAYVIIDKQGIIRWVWEETELGHRRENAELLAHLEALA